MKQLRVALLCAFALGLGIGTVEVVGQMWIGGSLGGFLLAQFGGGNVTTIAELPITPAPYTRRLITDGQTFNDCTVGGATANPYTVDCLYDPNLGGWRATDATPDLQASQEAGSVGGWTNLPSSRPLLIQPGQQTWGDEAAALKYMDESGNIKKVCDFGPAGNRLLCNPEDVNICDGCVLFWTYEDGVGSTVLGSIENTGGVLTKTGIFDRTWHLPWSASGAVLDGTACVLGTKTQINSGPLVVPVVCADDDAGSLELSFDTPTRYTGGAVTFCLEANDAVDVDSVIDFDVEGQFRPSGSVVNSTFSAPVEASVTLATANASYFACATLTPNGAAAGVGRLYIRATVHNTSGSHTDSNARILGGYLTGE